MGGSSEFHIHAHAEHRKRVQAAKPIIDNKPPILHAGNFSRFSKLKEDVQTFVARNQANADLLVQLNRIVRTRGVTDSFRTASEAGHCNLSTTVPVRIKELERIEEENMRLGKLLLCVPCEVDTWQKIPLRQDKEKKKSPVTFTVAQEILDKYSHIDIPKDPMVARTLFRPKIWFNLEVKGIRPLGLIAIQLFTEAAPQIVLEFVRLCNGQQQNRLKFVRLFPCLWLEGEIQLSDDTLVGKNIEYDKRAVDHGTHTGILSFSLDHMKICREGFMYYTISFKPLRVLNGHRVGFGRVVSGLKILNCIQDYGTKNGKPTKELVVSSCGLFK